MEPRPTPTSYYGNLVVLCQALSRLGLNVDALLEEAGVDLDAFRDGDGRVPWKQVDRVWELAVERTGDPCLGLEVVDGLNPAVYRSLGIALICSSSLRDFLQRLTRFFAVISTLEVATYQQHPQYACISDRAVVNYSAATVGCHSDAFAAFTLKFIRLIYRPDFQPLKVRLAWTPPAEHQHRYRESFRCPVEFGHDESAVFVALDDLDTPLAGANPELAMYNDTVALAVLEKLRELDLPTRVYARLIEYLPSGNCSRERVAHSLAMSESAFQKRLKQAGTSYQEVLDRTRNELAQHHLATGVTVDEVAYLLGFSDTSNFIRAFKRWTGTTPSAFRKSIAD